MTPLPRSAGRTVFGLDPAAYHAARPAYPDWVWAALRERCGLAPGVAAFEVGPGTGIASARLLALGADPLVGFEPDPRLADWLARTHPHMQVRHQAFEDADLSADSFDLGLAATSFHWVDPARGHAQAARFLKPGGWWVMVWNEFGDPARSDPFHEATVDLLTGGDSPSAGELDRPTYALDIEHRTADLAAAGFIDIAHETRAWPLTLDAGAVRALYATYSGINVRAPDDRARVLDALFDIADREFGGMVTRNMVTTLWTARRP